MRCAGAVARLFSHGGGRTWLSAVTTSDHCSTCGASDHFSLPERVRLTLSTNPGGNELKLCDIVVNSL